MSDNIFPSNLIKDFPTETEQIKYLINTLNEIKSQLSSLYFITQKQKTYFSSYFTSLTNDITSYYHNTIPYVNDPSNLYTLSASLLSLFETSTKMHESSLSSILPTLNSDIPFLTSSIDIMLNNIITTSTSLMSEISSLRSQSLQIKEKFQKSKAQLDTAQLKKKKIINDPATQYDDIVKQKAEDEIVSSVQRMEGIIPQMKSYSKKLELKKEIFNQHMKDTFELAVTNVFKGIVHLNQLFFLVGKTFQNVNNEFHCVLNNKIIKTIRNSSIEISDFSERKYAKSINIFFDTINFSDDTNGDDDTNDDIIELLDNIMRYIQIFLRCSSIRRKIISYLIEFIESYVKSDNEFVTKLSKIESKISSIVKQFNAMICNKNDLVVKTAWNMMSNLSHIGEMFHANLSKFISSRMLHILNEYKKVSKNEYESFASKWSKYEKKIIDYRNEYDKGKKKKDKKGCDEIEKKMRKLINEKIKNFINSNVSHLREKDKKRTIEIMSGVESILNLYEKNIDQSNEIINNLIDLVSTSDIFDDVKEIFQHFFDKFLIQNSENFMDTIKIKLLNKIDFDKEEIGQNIRKYLYNNSTILKDNNLNSSIISHQSFISSVNNEDLNLENENEIKENVNDVNKDIKTPSSSDDSNENIEIVNKENFDVIDHNKLNPYQNFKEKELKRILTKINKEDEPPNENELFIDNKIKIDISNETLIDKWKCAYKIRLINNPSGDLYLTSFKIIFLANKTKISVPLEDISSVNIVNTDFLEVKTKKTSFLFYNFENLSQCLNEIKKELTSKEKEEEKEENETTATNGNSKYMRQLKERNKDIASMLERIDFFKRLKSIHEQREKEFEMTYSDDNLLYKLPSQYHQCFYDKEYISNAPVSFIYNILINPDTVIEELGKEKGFFESMYINRNDKDIKLIKKEGEENNVPKFYSDIDYVCNLFTDIKEEELNELLKDVESWPKSTSYEIDFIHPLKKMIIGPDRITMKNMYTTHFVSPLCFVVDMMSFGSDFPFADTFVSMSQYRFNTEYKFNQSTGAFSFKTTVSMYFNIKFIKSCLFEGTVKSEGYKTSEEDVRFFVFENMKNISDSQSPQFQEMFNQLAGENLRRSLDKYKGECTVDEEEPNAEEEEKKEEEHKEEPAEEKKENIQINEKNNSETDEAKKKKRNMMILVIAIFAYFIIQTISNKHMSINEKILNIVLIGIIGYLIYTNFTTK